MRFREKLLRNERILKGNNVPRVCPSPWPSPGSLRSSPMRQDALGGLARRYWAVNPARKPRTAPFEGRRSLLSNGNHGGAIWFRFDPLDGKMRFSRRLLTIALQGARGSRDGRAKVDPRQDSRQGAQARGLSFRHRARARRSGRREAGTAVWLSGWCAGGEQNRSGRRSRREIDQKIFGKGLKNPLKGESYEG